MAAREQIIAAPTSLPGAPALGGASAEAFGAGIGRGMSQLGGALHQANVRAKAAERQNEENAANSQAAVDLATAVGELAIRDNELREAAPADGSGYLETVAAERKAWGKQYLDAMPEKVRERWAPRVAEMEANALADADGWARGRRIEALGANVRDAGDKLDNVLMGNPDPANFEFSIGATKTMVDGLNVPQTVRDKLWKEQTGRRARSYIKGLTKQDPAAAAKVIASGTLDDYLDPDDKAVLTDQAGVGMRMVEADQRRSQAAAVGDARAKINLFQKRLADHDPTITEDEIDRMGQLATSAGLGGEVYDLGKARVQVQVDKQYRNAAAPEIADAINQVSARIATAGDRASPQDVIALERLQLLHTKRSQETSNNPLGVYARGGGVVKPLVAGDAGSIRDRVAAAAAARGQTGVYRFFQPDEIPQLQEQLASGPQGKLAVAGLLAQVADVDGQAALRAASQIAPNDRVLRHSLRVAPGIRPMLMRGSAARATLPARLIGTDGKATTADAATQAWFNANVLPAIPTANGELADDALDAMRALYAEHRRRAGTNGEEEFDPKAAALAANLVLGGDGRAGGIAKWRGGVKGPDGRNPPFLLPPGMTAPDFERRMMSLPISRLGQRFPAGAVNGMPAWSNGTGLTTDELRGKFVPVAIGGGKYQFRNGNQLLHLKDGKTPFELNIWRMQPAAAPKPKPVLPAARGPMYIAPPDRHPDVRAPVWFAPPPTGGK